MSAALVTAMVSILLAATLYSIAVFAEQRSGVLKPWHLALFWTGLVFDTAGTTIMSDIAGGFELNIHGVLGVLAIVLMLVHAVWATVAIVQRREAVLRGFHRFSVAVWSLWMAALLTGFVLAVPPMLAAAAK